MNTYDELLSKLVAQRAMLEGSKQWRDKLIEDVKGSQDYLHSSEMIATTEFEINQITGLIRDLAMTEWINTKNKHPHEKVEVKVFKTFKILNADTLREWVFKNLPAALSPDLKKVEKYALEIGDVDGTQKGEEARVQIASKL